MLRALRTRREHDRARLRAVETLALVVDDRVLIHAHGHGALADAHAVRGLIERRADDRLTDRVAGQGRLHEPLDEHAREPGVAPGKRERRVVFAAEKTDGAVGVDLFARPAERVDRVARVEVRDDRIAVQLLRQVLRERDS